MLVLEKEVGRQMEIVVGIGVQRASRRSGHWQEEGEGMFQLHGGKESRKG